MNESPSPIGICPTCGKRVFATWMDALAAANRLRQRYGRTGMHPYWSRHCRAFHCGARMRRRHS